MDSLTQHLPSLKRSSTCRVESLVLLLALACLLVARFLPAQSLKVMAMPQMQMPMATGADHPTPGEEAQPHHDCFDGTLRCMNMMGGLCPLAQVNCVPAYAARLFAPQAQFPVQWVHAVGSSLGPGVPKQPPRR